MIAPPPQTPRHAAATAAAADQKSIKSPQPHKALAMLGRTNNRTHTHSYPLYYITIYYLHLEARRPIDGMMEDARRCVAAPAALGGAQ